MSISQVIGSVIRFGIQMIPVAILLAYYLITGAVHPHYELWILLPFLLLWLGLLGIIHFNKVERIFIDTV